MSAAATAAGYLYASGRLRGRGAREQNEAERPHEPQPAAAPARREVKVAAYRPDQTRERDHTRERREEPEKAAAAPRRVPKVQYRTRRWRPE